MWQEEAHALALLELWATGALRRRKAQGAAWDELDRLPWTRRTSRRGSLVLDPAYRGDLERLLDRSLPGWRELGAELERQGLPRDLHGHRTLAEQRRAEGLPDPLPARMNLRTASAALGRHSKASLGARLLAVLGPLEVTRDGLVRLRPNPGLVVEGGGASFPAADLARCLGEVALSERALKDGATLRGSLPRALLLVENVGFYADVAPPEGWMVAHVPGWNTRTVDLLLRALPDVPVLHLGDLDPNGVRIVAHLQAHHPRIRWAVPPFWEEQIPLRAQRRPWPADLALEDAPPLLRRLAREGLWLEQEPLVLDPRLARYLEEEVGREE